MRVQPTEYPKLKKVGSMTYVGAAEALRFPALEEVTGSMEITTSFVNGMYPTMLEEIYEAARQAAPSGTDETLLKRLCEISAAQWEARLKDGVTAEDCRTVFVCAAAWMAVVGIYTQKSVTGWNIESFTVGDVSVRTTGLENTSQMSAPQKLEWQARMLMRPFCRPEGFAFVGVRG